MKSLYPAVYARWSLIFLIELAIVARKMALVTDLIDIQSNNNNNLTCKSENALYLKDILCFE